MDIVKYIAVIFLIDPVISIKDVTLENLNSQTVSTLLNILNKYRNNIKYIKVQPNARKPTGISANNIGKIQNRNSLGFGINDRRTNVKDVTLENLNSQTVSTLLNILNKYRNNIEYIKIQPNVWKSRGLSTDNNGAGRNDEKSKKPLAHNKILIKRLIPHGLPSSGLEYDGKFNSLYRPLVRVHKRKPIPKIKTILNFDGSKDDVGIDKYGIDLHDYYDNDEDVVNFVKYTKLKNEFNIDIEENPQDDEELLQPFLINTLDQLKPTEDTSTQLKMLREINKLLTKRSIRFKTYDKIIKILDNIKNLRTYAKSSEAPDSLAAKVVYNLDEDGRESTTKPKLWMPHYPPWNYWTYHKTIHQDVCPKGQVKINDRCIWIPPH